MDVCATISHMSYLIPVRIHTPENRVARVRGSAESSAELEWTQMLCPTATGWRGAKDVRARVSKDLKG
jgi:hypothetical protein